MTKELKLEMQEYAMKFDVPIIEEGGLVELEKIIKRCDIKSVLEIGTAIGYSALNMHSVNGCVVYTIERDEKMYSEALSNIKKANKGDYIHPFFGDALLSEFDLPKTVDMLYIDAAKSQYRRFFEKYEYLLHEDSIVVFDNLKFHGYVDMPLSEIKSRNLRQLIRKLKEFNEYVRDVHGYDFEFIDVGDGIGILKRSKND